MNNQYHLLIRLENCHVPIVRELVVPASIRLDWLHKVIQIAMGWNDSHLHAFHTEDGDFTAFDPDYDDNGMEDERSVSLQDVVNEDYPGFGYEYDFGDDWQHSVEVKSFNYNKKVPHPIHCLKAQGACPPENVGGVRGYERFCEIINDPKHPEHEEVKDWAYGTGEYLESQKWPDSVSAAAINRILHYVKYKELKSTKRKKNPKSSSPKGKYIMLDDCSGFLEQAIIDKIMKETPPDKLEKALWVALQAQGQALPKRSLDNAGSKPGKKKLK